MSELSERLEAYREAFDRSFREPARAEPPQRALLAVQAGDRSVAIDVSEVSRVDRVGRIARIAGPPARIGLAAVRGRLLAVWDLAVLLGSGRLATDAPWLVVTEPGIALACDAYQGLLRVPETGLRPVGDEREGSHVVAVIRGGWGARAVIGLGSVRAVVSDRAGLGGE